MFRRLINALFIVGIVLVAAVAIIALIVCAFPIVATYVFFRALCHQGDISVKTQNPNKNFKLKEISPETILNRN